MATLDKDFAIKLAQVASCLEAIEGCNQQPGHVAYLTKAEAAKIAGKALTILEVAVSDFEAGAGISA